MRLLISLSKKNTNTIGHFFIQHFDKSIDVEGLEYPDKFAALLQSPFYKFVYRVWPALIVRMMDNLFLRQVNAFKPTVILIFKGMEISRWALKKIRRQNIRLVNYNLDHPFHFFSRGTGNRFVEQAIPFYDLHITYSSIIAADLQKLYNVKSAWIPFGFHLTPEQFQQVMHENRPEILRVCFVGNPDKLRIAAINQLLEEHIPIDLFGFGWEKCFQTNDLLVVHPPRTDGAYWTDPLEFWKVLRQYRVQLNFFRPHNEGSHNLRTFEVPAVGGILLTPASKEQAEFFSVGEEVFFYRNLEELINQCKYLLSSEETSIAPIRENARKRSLREDYSYKRRTNDLMSLLK